MFAVSLRGNRSVVELLLKGGADVNAKDFKGGSVLDPMLLPPGIEMWQHC